MSKLTKFFASFDAGDLAGLVTWAVVFVLCIVLMPRLPETSQAPLYLYGPLFLLYAVMFVLVTRSEPVWRLSPQLRGIGLALMLLSAFALGFLLSFDFLAILTIIWVAVLAFYLPSMWAILITVGVVCLWFLMMSWRQDQALWIQAILYGTFHMFALFLASSNKRQLETSAELRAKNDQLLATQHLLAEVSKQSERTRIARDMHDLLGHHLTGLTIKLQVASRLTEGEAKSQVDECHSIAKLLLSDVREAVDTLRSSDSIDFEKAVRLLINNVPQLSVHLNLPERISIEKIDLAQTILRCIQEAITNTLRHSGANQLWISLENDEHEIKVTIFDDGKVGKHWQKGNGLTGMEERVIELGGSILLSIHNHALHYEIKLPFQFENPDLVQA